MTNANRARLSLLVFDLDGTLIDSQADLYASVNATRRSLALDPLPPDIIASYVGQGVAPLVRRALGAERPPEALAPAVSYFLNYYKEHMLDHTLLYPGVRDTLDALQGRKLAVLTNKPVNFSRRILQSLGVASCFGYIYGGNSFELKKPDPVGIVQLMRDTRLPADRTMIIGDSDTDIHAGHNAGIWTCAVTYGIGSRTLANAAPHFVLSDFRQLLALVNGSTSHGSSEPISTGTGQ